MGIGPGVSVGSRSLFTKKPFQFQVPRALAVRHETGGIFSYAAGYGIGV